MAMITPVHTPPRPHVHGMAPPSRPHHCELSRPLHLHDPRPCSHTRDHGHRLDAHARCPVAAHLCLATDARIASSPSPRPRLAERLAGKHQGQLAQCPTPAPSLLSWADCSSCNIGPVALCWPSLSSLQFGPTNRPACLSSLRKPSPAAAQWWPSRNLGPIFFFRNGFKL